MLGLETIPFWTAMRQNTNPELRLLSGFAGLCKLYVINLTCTTFIRCICSNFAKIFYYLNINCDVSFI
jgi:hypothetical protein